MYIRFKGLGREILAKIHIDLTVSPEIPKWAKKNGIVLSHFFEEAWKTYIAGDTEVKTKITVNRILALSRERDDLIKDLELETGKKFEQLRLETIQSPTIRTSEDSGLGRLYRAMSEDQKKVLAGKDIFSDLTITHVRNWIDARKEDFDILMPTDMIIEKLKNNGGVVDA